MQKLADENFVDTFESSDGKIRATRALETTTEKITPMKTVAPTSLNDDPRRDDNDEFRQVFHRFVGETLFAQMLKSMRASQQALPYFGGGRAEEIFQGQLDQVLVEKMTTGTSNSLSDTMFNLMNARQNMQNVL